MRREIFRSDTRRALALLARAEAVHLATTTPEGAPVLRALDAAVLEDGVYFHGARSGEKARCLGRPAVVSAEEIVAHVPSWMIHPSDACQASTLYRSVQVHGTMREVTAPAEKARALEALVRRWQPEGRYDPIDPTHPHYAGELRGTLVFAVPFERVDGKRLRTRDAQGLYAKFGFVDAETRQRWPGSSDMVLARPAPALASGG